jgi:ribosomal protein S15P/S13E
MTNTARDIDSVIAEVERVTHRALRATIFRRFAAMEDFNALVKPPVVQLLIDEIRQLRNHVADLNHDHEATIAHCNKYHVEGYD